MVCAALASLSRDKLNSWPWPQRSPMGATRASSRWGRFISVQGPWYSPVETVLGGCLGTAGAPAGTCPLPAHLHAEGLVPEGCVSPTVQLVDHGSEGRTATISQDLMTCRSPVCVFSLSSHDTPTHSSRPLRTPSRRPLQRFGCDDGQWRLRTRSILASAAVLTNPFRCNLFYSFNQP